MARYWIGVASRDHVQRGVVEGFCQLCHGKPGPLRRLRDGDGIVYYAPRLRFSAAEPCRRFVALGWIDAREPWQVDMGGGFRPWRRGVRFVPVAETPIAPLVDALRFIRDKRRWSAPFRFGFVEIGAADFATIAAAMGVQDGERDRLADLGPGRDAGAQSGAGAVAGGQSLAASDPRGAQAA